MTELFKYLRGGSCYATKADVRVGGRSWTQPIDLFHTYGMRVVRLSSGGSDEDIFRRYPNSRSVLGRGMGVCQTCLSGGVFGVE